MRLFSPYFLYRIKTLGIRNSVDMIQMRFSCRLVLSALNTLKHIFAGGVFCGDLDVTEPQLLTELLDAVQHIRRSQSTPRVIALTEL